MGGILKQLFFVLLKLCFLIDISPLSAKSNPTNKYDFNKTLFRSNCSFTKLLFPPDSCIKITYSIFRTLNSSNIKSLQKTEGKKISVRRAFESQFLFHVYKNARDNEKNEKMVIFLNSFHKA